MKKKFVPPGSTPFDFVVYCTDGESTMLSVFGTVKKLDKGRYVVVCETELERASAMRAISKWGYHTTGFLVRPEGEQ